MESEVDQNKLRNSPHRFRAMTSSVADYALIGDCETAALVARNGSIDWLCLPGFDSPACFATLLGTGANGRWLIAPWGRAHIKRRYRPHSLILETTFSEPRPLDCGESRLMLPRRWRRHPTGYSRGTLERTAAPVPLHVFPRLRFTLDVRSDDVRIGQVVQERLTAEWRNG